MLSKVLRILALSLLTSLPAWSQSPVIGASATSIQGTSVSSASSSFGQGIQGNGTSLSAAYGTLALSYPGGSFFGDSNMCGFGSTSYTADPATPASLGASLGPVALIAPDLGGTVLNYCYTGAMAGDVSALKVFLNTPVSYTHQPLSVVVIGTNEANTYGISTGAENNYQANLNAIVQVLGIPTANMVTGQAMTKTGTWTNDSNLFAGTVASYSNVPSATATATITTYGGPLYVGWVANNTALGTATITVDGNAASCAINSSNASSSTVASVGFNGQSVTTNLGTLNNLFGTRCTVSAGTHTVVFTHDATTNYFEVAYVTTPTGNPGYSPNNIAISPPRVILGSVQYQYLNANAAATSAYDQIVQTTVSAFQKDGVNIQYAPLRSYINPNSSADMNCGASNQALHNCNAGYVQEKDAIEATIQPAIGSILSATSATYTPGALSAGTCASPITTTVAGATVGMSANASSPVSDMGAAVTYQSWVSAANTVSTRVCVLVAGTPNPSAFNIRVSK